MKTQILVIGDSCLDIFIKGSADRLCPEAPVPVLKPVNKTINPGMAGNVVENLRSLLPDVEVDFMTNSSVVTKTRYVDKNSGYILLRVDEGDKLEECITLENVIHYLKKNGRNSFDYDAIVISDYDKGLLKAEEIDRIVHYFSVNSHGQIFMDTKKILGKWSQEVDYVKINSKEFQEQLKHSLNPEQYCMSLIVTMGSDGSKLVGDDETYIHVKGEKVEVMDVSGAGDTYLAAFVIKTIQGYSTEKAMAYANKAAAIAVSKHGVVAVKQLEVGC